MYLLSNYYMKKNYLKIYKKRCFKKIKKRKKRISKKTYKYDK